MNQTIVVVLALASIAGASEPTTSKGGRGSEPLARFVIPAEEASQVLPKLRWRLDGPYFSPSLQQADRIEASLPEALSKKEGAREGDELRRSWATYAVAYVGYTSKNRRKIFAYAVMFGKRRTTPTLDDLLKRRGHDMGCAFVFGQYDVDRSTIDWAGCSERIARVDRVDTAAD